MAQIIQIATEEEMRSSGMADFLEGLGAPESAIRDGGAAAGRTTCCGPVDNIIFFFVPEGSTVELGDIVEVQSSVPDVHANRVIAVRQRTADMKKQCRWFPEDERLWYRLLECDWMQDEGWTRLEGREEIWVSHPAEVSAD